VIFRKLSIVVAAVLAFAALPPAATDTAIQTSEMRFRSPDALMERFFANARRQNEVPEDFYLFAKTSSGELPTLETLAAARRQERRVARLTAARAPRLIGRRWREVGPSNIGGRVNDLVVDPKRENTIYVATASGGMWKSTDAGRTFKPIWKKNRTQSLGALAMTKGGGALYVGTGEANPGGGSLVYGGNGVYKSTNRGRTWHNVGLRDSSRIGRIAINPKNPRHVLVAATGHLFNPGGQRGLYETRNGGRTWDRILKGENKTTGAVDVAFDPKDPKTIFVTMWDHQRFPDYRRYAGVGSGVYRSTNGGRSFQRLGPANGLPAPSDVSGGRIGVAIDPQRPRNVYVLYANNNEGSFQGWFKSTNGGDTFIAPPVANVTLQPSQFVYGWWFGRVWVDPYDSDHIFVSGWPLAESTDGGMSFPTLQFSQHVDHHAIAWDPHRHKRVYNGTDGGVYRSEKDGEDGTWIHGKYQPWVQFYQIDVSLQDPSRINGGLQDQGSVRSWGGEGKGWDHYNGGDGVENVINPKDKNNVYACSQYGACGESDNGGDTLQSWECQEMFSARCGWLTPIEIAPHNSKVAYWAGDKLVRSSDQGESWEPISPDLGGGDPGREVNPLYAGHYGTIQAIGLNKKKPRVIYAGTDNHKLWKTKDLGGAWRQIDDKVLPNRWITHIEVKRNKPRVLYVTFSGYRNGERAAYVFRSRNGGKDWRDISKNLPRAPVNDAALRGRKLYVATDLGVFVTKTNGIRWFELGRGLPLAPVNDIRLVPKNKKLYAGTFGRGVWKLSLRRRR
jgi:photosystem II stability/assembly factor-like uncharacterized protein